MLCYDKKGFWTIFGKENEDENLISVKRGNKFPRFKLCSV